MQRTNTALEMGVQIFLIAALVCFGNDLFFRYLEVVCDAEEVAKDVAWATRKAPFPPRLCFASVDSLQRGRLAAEGPPACEVFCRSLGSRPR